MLNVTHTRDDVINRVSYDMELIEGLYKKKH